MSSVRSSRSAVVAVVALGLTFAACGGSGSEAQSQSGQVTASSSTTAPTTASTPSSTAPPTAAPPAAKTGIAEGDYVCDYRPTLSSVPEQKGTIEMRGDGTYKYLENGDSGRYELDSAGTSITWLDGPLADKAPMHTNYKVNQHTTQIDILFEEFVEWSCGHNL